MADQKLTDEEFRRNGLKKKWTDNADGSYSQAVTGGGGGGGGGAVTVADGADVTQGAIADAAVTNPASSGSVIALLKGFLSGIKGKVAAGAAATGTDPVLAGGSDGTNVRNIATDTSGRQVAVGAAADGAAVTGNPVLMAGQDGTNAQSVLTDTTGRQVVVGAAADGASPAGSPVLIAGWDGTNVQQILGDTSGRLTPSNSGIAQSDGRSNTPTTFADHTSAAITGMSYPYVFNGATWDRVRGGTAGNFVQGPSANGAAQAGNPVLMGGYDGANSRALNTDTTGRPAVTNQPIASGGCDIYRNLDLDEADQQIKATAGTLYGWYICNTSTTTRYLKFYNATAASVTVGTTTPVMTLPIPGNSADDVSANLLGGVGIAFATAITVAVTTAAADADTGAPGTGDVIVNIFYK